VVKEVFTNPIILVSSCRKDVAAGLNQAIRETWGKKPAIPVFFLLGERNVDPLPDEIVFPVPDDYLSLPFKTKAGHKWAREQGYGYIFQCFTDTYVDTERLLRSGFEKGDYVGNLGVDCGRGHQFRFCHGGPGYWLSPKTSDLLLAAGIGEEKLEDQWVGLVMQKNRIAITDDSRYSMGTTYRYREPLPLPRNHQISCHLSDSGHKYEASMMFAAERLRMTGK
jgi:hypothetical protein